MLLLEAMLKADSTTVEILIYSAIGFAVVMGILAAITIMTSIFGKIFATMDAKKKAIENQNK